MFTQAERRAVGEAARAEGIGPEAHVLAVTQVESAGVIFAQVDGRDEPLIRFEGHIFYRRLKGGQRDRAVAERVAHPKALRVKNPRSQTGRWKLLALAMRINSEAALESCSWGVGQVMGFHWRSLGYASVHELVDVARSGLRGQVELMLRFIKVNHLDDELEAGQWDPFARGYNGPAYRKNRYAQKMRAAAAMFGGRIVVSDGMLRMGSKGARVRELQALLLRAGHAVGVDGDFGPATKAALVAFQKAAGLTPDGVYGPKTEAALGEHRQSADDKPGKQAVTEIEEVQKGAGAAVAGTLTIEVVKSTLDQAAEQISGAGIASPVIDLIVSGLTIASAVIAVGGVAYAAWGFIKSKRTVEA
ncbi:DUF3380 domain-containing protein [Aurantimonas sp. DM33-3]|uniref:N-acetylmuramidase domain-containing protein n=1 Tax=Aurantimonas sp. DM33-3 TaxID=2766955 RepID=UPI00165299BA|nr:N-acetylmuramidase domain-containing protein [Aurantimonas sp. DM33-3]MBC6714809.1 DUF3380 domain-containing protein [Aurantimonas sp. DM33-3]